MVKKYTVDMNNFDLNNLPTFMAAEAGDAVAQCNLGNLYSTGTGVKRDYVEALKWYHASAEQGDDIAQVNLGVMYEQGQGTPQDYGLAKDYFLLASKKNNDMANFNLGLLYFNGHGVPINSLQANKYFQLSAQKNNPDAIEMVKTIHDDCNHAFLNYTRFLEAYNLPQTHLDKFQVLDANLHIINNLINLIEIEKQNPAYPKLFEAFDMLSYRFIALLETMNNKNIAKLLYQIEILETLVNGIETVYTKEFPDEQDHNEYSLAEEFDSLKKSYSKTV